MCKRLLDILHPLNIFGKKIVHRTFDTSDTPVVNNEKEFTVIWEGYGLMVAYTTHRYQRAFPQLINKYESVERYFHGGGTETFTAPAYRPNPASYNVIEGNVIYFKCVKVTKLIVNGEQLI